MSGLFKILFLVGLVVSPVSPASARLLQIIHTNDLHSCFEHGDEPNLGGYAVIKAWIEALRAQAAAQGVETLVLDAGDFSEGTMFYLAENGQTSWKMMDSMGYDAVVIGNHDWLVGARELEQLLEGARPTTPFLGANFQANPGFPQLAKTIRPYTEVTRAGLKIGILGLTTNELAFKWRVHEGTIANPYKAALQWLPYLNSRNDLVIVLSHLGFSTDKKLVRASSGIDLVVGGHSHTRLEEPFYVSNLAEESIPILQTGAHGNYLGVLLLDAEPGKAPWLLDYQLLPVSSDSPQDREIATLIQEARSAIERKYTREWLYEPIAFSTIPLERPNGHRTDWGDFVAKAIQEAAGADLSFDGREFFGATQGPGTITRERIIESYPRVFAFRNPYGWTVWTVRAPGWLVQSILQLSHRIGYYLNTAGVTYKIRKVGKTEVPFDYRIKGKRLNPARIYTIAISEGLGRGGNEVSKMIRNFIDPEDTNVPIWTAIESKLRQGSSGTR